METLPMKQVFRVTAQVIFPVLTDYDGLTYVHNKLALAGYKINMGTIYTLCRDAYNINVTTTYRFDLTKILSVSVKRVRTCGGGCKEVTYVIKVYEVSENGK